MAFNRDSDRNTIDISALQDVKISSGDVEDLIHILEARPRISSCPTKRGGLWIG
jgi:hypothetical protein